MGCGASLTADEDAKDDKTKPGNALSVVPSPNDGKGGRGLTPRNGKSYALVTSDNDAVRGNELQSVITPFVDNATCMKLYNPLRLICTFEDASPEARDILWSIMKGQRVFHKPPPLPLPVFPPPPVAALPPERGTASPSTSSRVSVVSSASASQKSSPMDATAGARAHSHASNLPGLVSAGSPRHETTVARPPPVQTGSSSSTPRRKPLYFSVACDVGKVSLQLDPTDLSSVEHSANMTSDEAMEFSGTKHYSSSTAAVLMQKSLVPAKVCNYRVRSLSGHGRPVRIVGLSADTRVLVTGDGVEGRQLLLRCVDPITGSRIGSLANRGFAGDAPCDLCFTTNSQALVTCDQSDSVLMWDMTTYRCKKTVRIEGDEGSELFVIGVRMSPDGTMVVAAAEQISEEGVNSGCVVIRNLPQKKQVLTFKEHGSTVLCIEVSSDSKRVISGARDSTLFVWDIYTGAVQFTLTGHVSGIRSCSFSPCGRYIVSLDSKLCAVWSAHSGRCYHCLTVEGELSEGEMFPAVSSPRANKVRFTVAAFIPAGLLLLAYSNRTVKVLDPFDMSEVFNFQVKSPITCASPSCTSVAMGDLNGNVYVLDLAVRPTLREDPRVPRLSTSLNEDKEGSNADGSHASKSEGEGGADLGEGGPDANETEISLISPLRRVKSAFL